MTARVVPLFVLLLSPAAAVHPPARAALALRARVIHRNKELVAVASAPAKPWLAIAAYSSIGAGFAGLLTKTIAKHPIFPFQPESASWSFSWLITTVFDYYGAALCLRAGGWDTLAGCATRSACPCLPIRARAWPEPMGLYHPGAASSWRASLVCQALCGALDASVWARPCAPRGPCLGLCATAA